MSIDVMSRVWAKSNASESSLLVMLALADRADDTGVCWPSLESISKKARIKDERHIRRILRRLEDTGELYVSAGQGRGRTSLYLVCIGLDVNAIAGILVKRFEMTVTDAMTTAQKMVARRPIDHTEDESAAQEPSEEKGGLEAQKGGYTPPIAASEKGGYTREKGGYTREKGGYTPPDPSMIHQDPSMEDNTAREASHQQPTVSSSSPAPVERIKLPEAVVAALIQPHDPAYLRAKIAYEDNIGEVKGLVPDMLKKALRAYPPEWIPLAIERAVAADNRTWRYVEGILRNWSNEGFNGTPQRINTKQPGAQRTVSAMAGQYDWSPDTVIIPADLDLSAPAGF